MKAAIRTAVHEERPYSRLYSTPEKCRTPLFGTRNANVGEGFGARNNVWGHLPDQRLIIVPGSANPQYIC